MNDSDTDANVKAIDSLLNYETVKYFSAEEREAATRFYAGESDLPTFTAGARVTLEGHPRLGSKELLLVEVQHELVQAAMNASGALICTA